MVLDNDDAVCRMGVTPTYKKVKGYHPIQMTWNGMIIDGIFRRGDRYTHEFKQTSAMIRRMVRKIRETLGNDVAIIVTMDAGYCDEKLIRYLDEDLKVALLSQVSFTKTSKLTWAPSTKSNGMITPLITGIGSFWRWVTNARSG